MVMWAIRNDCREIQIKSVCPKTFTGGFNHHLTGSDWESIPNWL